MNEKSTSNAAPAPAARKVGAALALTIFLFAGCGSSSNNDTDRSSQSNAPESVALSDGDESTSDGSGSGSAEEAAILEDPDLVRDAAINVLLNEDNEMTIGDDGVPVFSLGNESVSKNADDSVSYTNPAGTRTVKTDPDTYETTFANK